ncbi:MAG: hemerythrin family protein [Magnetococcales bacterium]|nr:hemerythrin family protein [Magnetococcales bacterium]
MDRSASTSFHEKLAARLVDVGVPRFNEDHARLLEIIVAADRILDAMITPPVPDGVQQDRDRQWQDLDGLIARLADYTQSHFMAEESLMKQYGYPDLEPHRLEHQELVAQLLAFQQRIQDRSPAPAGKMRRWLLEWLLHHVNRLDAAYGVFFKEINVV